MNVRRAEQQEKDAATDAATTPFSMIPAVLQVLPPKSITASIDTVS